MGKARDLLVEVLSDHHGPKFASTIPTLKDVLGQLPARLGWSLDDSRAWVQNRRMASLRSFALRPSSSFGALLVLASFLFPLSAAAIVEEGAPPPVCWQRPGFSAVGFSEAKVPVSDVLVFHGAIQSDPDAVPLAFEDYDLELRDAEGELTTPTSIETLDEVTFLLRLDEPLALGPHDATFTSPCETVGSQTVIVTNPAPLEEPYPDPAMSYELGDSSGVEERDGEVCSDSLAGRKLTLSPNESITPHLPLLSGYFSVDGETVIEYGPGFVPSDVSVKNPCNTGPDFESIPVPDGASTIELTLVTLDGVEIPAMSLELDYECLPECPAPEYVENEGEDASSGCQASPIGGTTNGWMVLLGLLALGALRRTRHTM